MSGRTVSEECHRWLRYAKEDLAAKALHREPSTSPRHACWVAQQSAEKALKAALIALQIDYPRNHDLDLWLRMLPAHWNTRRQVPDLSELGEWSIEARYPGEWPEPSADDAFTAIDQAQTVLGIIEADLVSEGLV